MQKSNQHRGDRNKTYRSVQGNRLLQVGYLHLRVSNLGRREAVDFNYFFSNFSAWHRHQCLVYKKKKDTRAGKTAKGLRTCVFSFSEETDHTNLSQLCCCDDIRGNPEGLDETDDVTF